MLTVDVLTNVVSLTTPTNIRKQAIHDLFNKIVSQDLDLNLLGILGRL